LDAYTIVLLRRPKDATEMSERELEALQRDHLAFNARMREAGHALVSGPFADQPDESWRGISISSERRSSKRASWWRTTPQFGREGSRSTFSPG